MTDILPESTNSGSVEFQERVRPWLLACFGEMIACDREERNHRFLEEALELVQSCGCTASEAHQLVDYVFARPVGEPTQEVGGAMVTLAALCLANDLDMHAAAEVELARIWTKVEAIREKQAAKPKHSPLPEAASTALDGATLREKVAREAGFRAGYLHVLGLTRSGVPTADFERDVGAYMADFVSRRS